MTSSYKFTEYFENEVVRKRPYIKKEWCIQIIKSHSNRKTGTQPLSFLGGIDEFEGKILRVVTLDDMVTIHNAFPDRRFKNEN
jgi:hypothetical protein